MRDTSGRTLTTGATLPGPHRDDEIVKTEQRWVLTWRDVVLLALLVVSALAIKSVATQYLAGDAPTTDATELMPDLVFERDEIARIEAELTALRGAWAAAQVELIGKATAGQARTDEQALIERLDERLDTLVVEEEEARLAIGEMEVDAAALAHRRLDEYELERDVWVLGITFAGLLIVALVVWSLSWFSRRSAGSGQYLAIVLSAAVVVFVVAVADALGMVALAMLLGALIVGLVAALT